MNDPRLQAALQSHQAGNLVEAARLYSDILRSDPKNFDALYLLGFVHLQHRDFAQAERLLDAALSVNPRALDALSATVAPASSRPRRLRAPRWDCRRRASSSAHSTTASKSDRRCSISG
jgi:thioredoxin-like negative regulator of GroEL